MRETRSIRTVAAVVVFLVSVAPAFAAHAADDPVPISNWTAPPYWAPAASQRLESKRLEAPAVASPPLPFHAVTPCRIADTRGNGFTGPYGPPNLTAGAVRSFVVTSPSTSCGIPSTAAAVSFNFAVVLPSANGNLVVYPTGASAPTVSSLNWTPAEIAISNAGVIPLGTGGAINVLVNGPVGSTTDLVIDVNGYYAADPLVFSVNGLSGDVTLGHDADVTVGVAGQTITIGTDATANGTPSTIVRRNASGDFNAGIITANLIGSASNNVAKAGDTMTGSLVMGGGDIDLGASGKLVRGSSLYLYTPFDTTNTFLGIDAGNLTLTSTRNTGVGRHALLSLTTGDKNTAVGTGAGLSIDAGCCSVAVGFAALNTSVADFNVAVGAAACDSCTGGSNTAVGHAALAGTTTGNSNIAIGNFAGSAITSGSNNILIANSGVPGDTNMIRIGNAGFSTAFLYGVFGATSPSGVPVLVSSGGQLGTTTSSIRFKEDVREMGAESELLQRLRPVTFRYKPEIDPSGIEEFGLIAEEVEQIRPDLVVCGSDGQPSAIRYQELVPMLVNEVQKDRREISELKARLEKVESLIRATR